MTRRIHFTKMHGAGNDYIYVDADRYFIADPSAAAIAWSDRHKGIGSDGLVLIGRSQSPEADFTMRIFNADGSEALMCGNASRCIGKYVYEKGLTRKTEIRLQTKSGIKTLKLHLSSTPKTKGRGRYVERVTVDMGTPILDAPTLFKTNHAPLLARGEMPAQRAGGEACIFVSMGNPHYVIFTDDIDQVDTLGPQLEHHEAFPQRCNIEFARVEADGSLRVRVWERGSGVTMACGTGACATAVAACLTGRSGRRSTIVMDGGTLEIEWNEADGHVYKTGPAAFVFEGTISSNVK